MHGMAVPKRKEKQHESPYPPLINWLHRATIALDAVHYSRSFF
jgi:hypothetical protein